MSAEAIHLGIDAGGARLPTCSPRQSRWCTYIH